MKKTNFTLLYMLAIVLAVNAQIALPYTNGFDNAGEIEDWVLYRKGLTTINGQPSATWQPYASTGAATPPSYLVHDYPVGYDGTEMTDDWLVSESIDFTNGARLSMKTWIYAIAGTVPGDAIEVYLLQGSQDPANAIQTQVASLTSMASAMGSLNTPIWKDTSDIIIPPTTDDAYLAIRYTCIHNWFTAAIDNLELVPEPTSVAGVRKSPVLVQLYPNPASGTLKWKIAPNSLQQLSTEEGVLFNYTGKELKRFPVAEGCLDISSLQPGLYYISIGATMRPFTKR